MRVSDFDYDLPAELIAQHPLSERDASRMLIVDRATQTWRDSAFASLPDCLHENDVLVLNNTRVFPARLLGQRSPSGGAVELLLLREIEPNVWSALARPARRLRTGTQITFREAGLRAEVVESQDDGVRVLRFKSERPLHAVIDEIGRTPLPPYIKREGEPSSTDHERYQTVYAKERGAIAAPTAGLHFTPRVLQEIEARGVLLAEITLHVGYGTFEPVRAEVTSEHRVAPEWFSVGDEAAQVINRARANGRRIIAAGTTTARALESSVRTDGQIEARSGFADLTIVPGYRLRAVDALLTNFHLPRSSLLMLVSAFAGRGLIIAAYDHAVRERYRFYSFGDCMLII
ncbi:MAG TPA: tRNA preQ1(34) S-adenosylmethionine ribosyltransferase-isomerase QueA [Pyrinomonadaceae bacterium]|nr:tRNA preQ1(34) S-adenosylmethionine ribosyltransferase-isomerase QueA [Pyrinomonadaceae bacterium]